MIVCAVWSCVLRPGVALAQGLDTLPLRTSSAEHIPYPARDSMPASHRSARGPVDQPAAVLYCPSPQYPSGLAAYGFDGEVDLQFVVDSTGRAELDDLLVAEHRTPDSSGRCGEPSPSVVIAQPRRQDAPSGSWSGSEFVIT